MRYFDKNRPADTPTRAQIPGRQAIKKHRAATQSIKQANTPSHIRNEHSIVTWEFYTAPKFLRNKQ